LIEAALLRLYFAVPIKSTIMKNLSYVFAANEATPISNASNVSLHDLVDRLMNSFLPLAVSKHSFMINDIEAGFNVQGDEQELAFVIGSMMMNAIKYSRSACVRIDVIRKYNGIQIRIRNNGACYYSTLFNNYANVAA
jgi:signal transduction histidine kinase